MLLHPYRLPEDQPFPTVERLRCGVLLGTLINVISAQPGSAPSDSFQWNGSVLWLNDYGGTRGRIAFTQACIVAGFFSARSERNPFGEDEFPPYDAAHYFAAAPPNVLTVARQAVLPHLERWIGDPALIEQAFDQPGDVELDMTKFVPVITAAFWSEGDALTADEPWSAVYHHGAHILWREFSDPDSVLDYVEQQLEVPRERLALARRLYERRLATTAPMMALTAEEYTELLAPGAPQLEPVRM